MKTFIIDGYNAIHKWPQLEQALDVSLKAARDALISLVLSRKSGADRYVIVFEGKDEFSDFNGQSYSGIKIIFTQTSQEADDRIIEMLRNKPIISDYAVVSDDNYVRNHAKVFGADLLAVRDFFAKPRVSNTTASDKTTNINTNKINEELKKAWGL